MAEKYFLILLGDFLESSTMLKFNGAVHLGEWNTGIFLQHQQHLSMDVKYVLIYYGIVATFSTLG